jgi:hypothetical protein
MKLRLEDKKRAIELRIQGKSYGEIMTIVPNLSKSTLSGWMKHVKLTPEQEKNLKRNIEKITSNARLKVAWKKKFEREKKTQEIIAKARKELPSLVKKPLFLTGLALYWAEGTKKSSYFRFTNSDPQIIKIIMRWLEEICQIQKKKIRIRIYIHKIYAHENCEKFWSKITGIPANRFLKTIYKPTPHKIKKNQEYKGCVQVNVSGVDFFRKLRGWINGLDKMFNGG